MILPKDHIGMLSRVVCDSHETHGYGVYMLTTGEPVGSVGTLVALHGAPTISVLGRELRRRKDIRRALYELNQRKLIEDDVVILTIYDAEEDTSTVTFGRWLTEGTEALELEDAAA